MTKKVYYDDKSEMTISYTKENKFIFEITDLNDSQSILFQNVELSTQDVIELIIDLQYYIDNQTKNKI